MDIETVRLYCLGKQQVTEGFPFDEVTLVFKVANKMFAILSLEKAPPQVSLKCDPERAIALREVYEEVQPGYHLSKVHWNTITLGGSLSETLLKELIDHSYDLIVKSLPKKVQQTFIESR